MEQIPTNTIEKYNHCNSKRQRPVSLGVVQFLDNPCECVGKGLVANQDMYMHD